MSEENILTTELQKRLQKLGLVRDAFSEAVVQLRLSFLALQTKLNTQVVLDSTINTSILTKINDLLPNLVQSAILLRMGLRKAQQGTKEVAKEHQAVADIKTNVTATTPTKIEQELIDVITRLTVLADQLKNSSYTNFLQPLKIILERYQQDLNRWNQANEEERQQLLIPMALVAGVDLAGIYSIKHTFALTLICRNAYGFVEKLNNFGNHPVAALGGIHFKPNPEGRDFVSPGMEYSVCLFHTLLSKQMLVAPTTLLKVYQVSIEKIDRTQSDPIAYSKFESARVTGQSLKELLTEQSELYKELVFQPAEISKVVQAGQTIEGISLHQLLELLQRFNWLDKKLGKAILVENLPALISGGYLEPFLQNNPRYHLAMSSKELTEVYLGLMATCAFSERLKNFKDLNVSIEKSLNDFQNATKGTSNKTILSLLALLTKWPQLMANEDLIDLLHLVELFALIPKLLPQSSPDQIYEILPNFMDRLGSYNFSAQFVASLLLNPYDGKADNYMVELEKDATGEVIKWNIIGIDNDKVLGPAITQTRRNGSHYPGMKFILGCMPQVNKTLDATFLQEFLAISPECLILKWLAGVYQQNLHYQQLIDSGILTETDLFDKDSDISALDIPIKFDRTSIPEIYRKLCLLQQYVRTNSTATHQNLFEQINLIMANFYKKVVEKKNYPLSAMSYLYQGDDTTPVVTLEAELVNELDTTMVSTLSGNKVMRAALQDETQSEIDFELERVHDVETVVKDFIQTLNLPDRMAVPEQLFAILQPIAEHMDFICELPLSVSQLNQLLHLSVQKNKPKLSALFLRCGADVNYRYYSQGNTILHIAICIDDIDLQVVEQLLKAPKRQQNLYDIQGNTPLFLINLRDEPLVKLLLRYGEDIDFVNPITKMSLIEQAVANNSIEIFSCLVKYGAGKYLSASIAMKFIKTCQSQPNYTALMQETHVILMQQNAKVAWLTGREAMTQEKPLLPEETAGLPPLAMQEINGLRAGKVYLKANVIKQLFSSDGKFKKSNEYGRRKVALVHCAGQKIHFKFYPEMPLVEEAVRCLARQIFLNGIVPETEVFRFFDDKKRPYPVLLSQHVEGENLQEIIKDPNKAKNMDTLLDHCSFSELILFTFLYNPEDGKPDNYIFSPFINAQGKSAYRIVSIDNDHAFVEPVLLQNNHRVMQVKTILYCLSQMQLPIHPIARDNFIKLDPKSIMSNWLLLLGSTQETCDQLFKENDRKRLFFEEDKENPIITRVPLKKGVVPKIYEKFVRLKAILQEYPEITHLELLKKVIPLLGIAHEQAFKRAVSKDENTPGARFHFLFSRQYSTIVAERFGTLITSKHILASAKIPDVAMYSSTSNDCSPQEALNELVDARSEESSVDLVISTLQQGNLKLFKQLHFDKTRSLVLEKVILSKLPAAARKDLLTYLSQVQIQYLDLSNSLDFNQKILSNILENSSEIETLNVSNCTQLNESFMMEVAKHGETVERLDISGLNWKKIGLDKGGFIKLPNLRRLWIKDVTQLTSIRLNAPLLKSLHIENAPKLVELIIIGTHLDSLIIKNSSLPVKYREILVGQSPELLKKPLRYSSDMPLTKEQIFRLCCCYGREIWTAENIQFITDKTATFKIADARISNIVLNKFIQHAADLTIFELKGAPFINYLSTGKLIKTYTDLKQIICNDYYNHSAIKKTKKMQLTTQPQDIFCYPNQILFSALANKTIETVDLNAGKIIQVLKGNDNAITAPTALTLFSSNLVSGHYDGTINVWNVAKGEIFLSLKGHSSRILTLKFMPQYNRLISASDDKTLKFWDLENAICEHSLNVGQKPVSTLEMLSEDQFMTGSRDGYLKVWDYSTKEVINTLQVSRSSVYAIAEIEKNIVATATGDGAIKLWNITNGNCITTLLGHKGAVLSLQILQSGHLLASGGVDSKICIWDLLTNKCIYELTEHKGNIIKLYLNEHGQLVSIDNLGMIQTWEFAQLVFDLEALKLIEKPFVLDFSPETLQIMVYYTDLSIFKQCYNFVMTRFSSANVACVIDETKNSALLAMHSNAYEWVESFFDSINARFKKAKYTNIWSPIFNQASSAAMPIEDPADNEPQSTLKPM